MRIALAVFALCIGLWLVVELRGVVALLLIALVVATGIFPLVEWLHARRFPPRGWRLPRWLVILGVLLSMVCIAFGVFYFLGSVFWSEATQFWGDLSSHTNRVSRWLDRLRNQFPEIPSEENLLTALQEQAGEASQYLWQTTSALLGVFGGMARG